MKHSKRKLVNSLLALLLCFSMLVGSTFAWFTDSVSTGINTIAAGNLDVELYHSNAAVRDEQVDASTKLFLDLQGNPILWEPGVVSYENLRVTNEGDLALAYQMAIATANENFVVEATGAQYGLSQILKVGVVAGGITATDRASVVASVEEANWTTLSDFVRTSSLMAEGKGDSEEVWGIVIYWEPGDNDNYWNLNNGKTLSSGDVLSIDLGINLIATQEEYEADAFGTDYDAEAKAFVFPDFVGGTADADVTVDDQRQTTEEVTMTSGAVSAVVPAGVKVAEGVSKLTLTVTPKDSSEANVSLGENEDILSLDVHIEGVDPANTAPIAVTLKEVAPTGLNMGNYKLYHVENGTTNEMTLIDSGEAFSAHNQFKYDPVTGDVVLYMASFSEVACVIDNLNAWDGNFNYEWYDANATELTIANADQLAGFGKIVGGMADGIERDSFADQTIKLLTDINLGDKENANENLIFHPIGYYYKDGDSTVKSFEGTFDGNGHTIGNFYQNTWEIKGDYDGTYYKDAMGLFGYVKGGIVQNLTVDHFSSDGEYTPTGVIAAYADGDANFENIAITNCNPRVYNTGNGGIIGIAGDTSAANDDHITLSNITVDNTNKISALWGSYDVACGGLVGMYRGNVDGNGEATKDTISFTNCHVSAKMDVYNDVCANYQYYAYRYTGMIIGSVRHNTTNDEGRTIPNMTGISAKDCTVNFGTWNDYYYCEIIDNTTASYTHDYQMSRLEQVTAVNGTTITPLSGEDFTVPSSGRYNYVVVNGEHATENATCYHFKDGKVWNHEDGGIQPGIDENGDGKEDLREDKQHIYLEFNNLFTGYGWGVSSMAIDKWNGITALGITTGSQEESVVKFETKFTGDFLYRVGNLNTVNVGSLFKYKDDIPEKDQNGSGVVVTVDKVDEKSNVGGTFTPSTTKNADGSVKWEEGKIQFSGNGIVKVTIQDYSFCTPTELIVEVIDATNLTSATGTTTGGKFVLLCNVNTSTYVNYWNSTLYGNGFTYSLKGAPTDYNSKQGHGIIITKNATLDNLVIIGDIYNSYGAYTNQDCYNAAVDAQAGTIIQNCYIANCAAPVVVRAGDISISDSTLYGGTVANLIIKAGVATLNNVTTANFDDGRSLIGMGIAVHPDATESAKLVLAGTFKQYNFINEAETPDDENAKLLYSTIFGSSCSKYHFGTSPNRSANTGVVSMSPLFNGEDITDNANTGYVGTSIKYNSKDGYVYSQPNTSGSVNNNSPEYKPTTQGAVPPSYSFDYTNKNYIAKTDGSNDYCYEENGKVNISMDEGDTFNWDTSILTIGKGITNYTVTMDGVDYTGKSIAFNTAGDYTVTYTYTDDNNSKLDENGNITTYSVEYTKTVNITVAVVKATTKHAEFTFGSSNTASTTVTVGNNTYVMPNVSGTSSTIGSTTVDGKTIYYPIVEIIMSDGKTSHTSGWYAYFPVFSGAVTITDYKDMGTGDPEIFGSSTQQMPTGLSVDGSPGTLFKYQSGSAAGTTPVLKNNILVYSSAKIEANRDEYNTVVKYCYTDNAKGTYYYYVGYHAPAQTYTNCVTPDTLITLADGSQVRVDSLKGDEQLLVWNLKTGKYDTAPIVFVDSEEEAEYEIIHLYFSDGSDVKVISEHGFFDRALGEYVYIDANNYADYVGHSFVTDGNISANTWNTAVLDKVVIEKEVTTAWSPVTYEHLCYYTNGVLSMPGGIEGLFNIFEVDTRYMRYDMQKMQQDIATYGLFTIEDFGGMITEDAFNAFNGAYLKVAIEKGLLTWEDIAYMAERYIPLM